MENKQTAVEYIMSQLRQLAFNENTHLGMGDVRVTQGLIDELEEQAKQMEKEQIIDSYEQGVADENEGNRNGQFTNAEKYYNERYITNNKTNDK